MKARVHKFGGAALATPQKMQNCVEIIKTEIQQHPEDQIVVVVSAVFGVTNELLRLAEKATIGQSFESDLESLLKRHLTWWKEWGGSSEGEHEFLKEKEELHQLLQSLTITKSEDLWPLVSSYGEPWSARLFSLKLPTSRWLNAREFIVVQNGEMGPEIHFDSTANNWNELNVSENPLVITGYLAKTPEGKPTTLQRNGSDWTASIMAYITPCVNLTIWKDVAGVMSTDPRLVPQAYVLDEISYDEASELSHFGSQILHPKTISPIRKKNVPITIKNVSSPNDPGTKILTETPDGQTLVKGFTVRTDLALINIRGTGMLGVPGVAERIFSSLHQQGISAIIISQSGSEQSLSVAVEEDQSEAAESALKIVFRNELQYGLIHSVETDRDCAMIAAVGDRMAQQPGVAARFFQAIAQAGVSIKVIAQGSSERNISAIVSRETCQRALKSVHAAFSLSHTVINAVIVGPGLIGKELIHQMDSQRAALKKNMNIDLRIRAIINSQSMWFSKEDSSLDANFSSEKSQPTDIESLISTVLDDQTPHPVMIDCTASEKIASHYPEWFAKGLHVITPNKKANSQNADAYSHMKSRQSQHRREYFYESTVGAGLPIISTLQDLIQTGDQLIRIRGLFSGTLAYIFNQLADNPVFSDVVKEAKKLGYTEPDPRDDLSGMDVARKLVILARESGWPLELRDIQAEPLISESLLQSPSVDDFLRDLPAADSLFVDKMKEAQEKGGRLMYIGTLDFESRQATMKMEIIPSTEPLASLTGSDNMVEFQTKRYQSQPLIVRGPGAGPAVTASGVFSDLLRLAYRLKGPS